MLDRSQGADPPDRILGKRRAKSNATHVDAGPHLTDFRSLAAIQVLRGPSCDPILRGLTTPVEA